MKNVCLFVLMVGLLGCSKTPVEVIVDSPAPYQLQLPGHFPLLVIPDDNPMTVEGVKLGRMLYYDQRLSKDGKRSCSTCHEQKAGFAKPGTNVLPHINLAWNYNFLWNGKLYGTLEEVMRFEVESFFESDPEVFNQIEAYASLFKIAYGVDKITHRDLAYALAQFFRTMISGGSEYDRYLQGMDVLSPAALRGMNLFFSERGDCFHCHGSILFTNNDFHNIGLEAEPEGKHLGIFEITGNSEDRGKFKTPTLRNVALRESYMHDGRFKTLEEVVEHYNTGIKRSPTLDPLMYKNRRGNHLGLSEEEQSDLVAFLKALTDEKFITNPDLGPPVK
jgi:cytochrome c peroxidase